MSICKTLFAAAVVLSSCTNVIAQNVSQSDSTYFDQVPDSLEHAILVGIYQKLDGPHWTHRDRWLEGNTNSDFAKWFGITVEFGDVVEINLQNNNLSGNMPSNVGRLSRLRFKGFEGNAIISDDRQRGSANPIDKRGSRSGTSKKVNLPYWGLAVRGLSAQKIDWRTSPPKVQNLPNYGTSVIGATGVAIDDCGELAFMVLYNGPEGFNNLHIYDNDGNKLTATGLNGIRANNELQVVRVPGKSDEWYIIYTLYRNISCFGGNIAYCAADVGYARVHFDLTTKQVIVLERDVLLGGGFIQGKAVSRTASGDADKHYLFLVKRFMQAGTNDTYAEMEIHRFVIDDNSIGSETISSKFKVPFWYLSISGSSVELTPDEQTLCISNRNELAATHDDIILFDLDELSEAVPRPKRIDLRKLKVQPDGNRLTSAVTLEDLYLTSPYNQTFDCFKYLKNKISFIEFSPSGRFLYAIGGGFPVGYGLPFGFANNRSYNEYLLQIDLQSRTDDTQYDVRIRVQQGVDIATNCIGPSTDTADPRRHSFGDIESAYDGNIYFTKGNEKRLFVIPHPDEFMTPNLTPEEVDLSIAGIPNIAMNDDAAVNTLPENIDGFDYLDDVELPDPSFSLSPSPVLMFQPVTVTLMNFDAATTFQIDWGDGQLENITSSNISHAYSAMGNYIATVNATSADGCRLTSTQSLTVNEACPQVADLFEDITISVTTDTRRQVINTSAATFAETWPLAFSNTAPANSFANGTEGIWRQEGQYAYDVARDQSPEVNTAIDGTFTLEMFNWAGADASLIPHWTKANEMTLYSPFSYELENRDVLDVYSAALYDYGGHLPSANGINMRNNEMAFTSFETTGEPTSGNWMLTNVAGPRYRVFATTLNKGNVAVVKAKLSELEDVEVVDVIGRRFNYWLGPLFFGNINVPYPFRFYTYSTFMPNVNIRCMQADPDNPEQTVIVLDKAPYTGIWTGVIRVKLQASPAAAATLDQAVRHTGKGSMRLTADLTLKQDHIRLDSGKTYFFNGWVSTGNASVKEPKLADGIGIDIVLKTKKDPQGTTTSIGASGPVIEGWQQVRGSFSVTRNNVALEVSFKHGAATTVWFDDIRLHPNEGNMKSYVYDMRDYRLRAILDEENFATLFYYDDEGNLYLTKKETVDGVKSLQENVGYIIQR